MKSAFDIFESELSKRGISYKGPNREGVYTVDVSGVDVTVNLFNIARNYKVDQDAVAVVKCIDRALDFLKPVPWEQARSLIYFSVEPTDYDFGDTVTYPVTASITKIMVMADLKAGMITWITPDMIRDWHVSLADVEAVARENMSSLLRGKRPEVKNIEGMKVGMLPIQSVFKASAIISPEFKTYVSKDLGWPVLAVIPCRDFIYVIPEKDKALLGRIGNIVKDEYQKSGYPITTEVIKISDNGFESIGRYPV